MTIDPIAYSHDDEYGTVRTADGSGKVRRIVQD